MFNETLIFQKLRKNRLLMLFSLLLFAIILAVTILVSANLVGDREQLIFESRASYTAETAASQFCALIDDGISQMRIASSGMDAASPEEALALLEDSELFRGAAVVDLCDRIVAQTGITSEFSTEDRVIRYDRSETDAYICVASDGSVALKVPAGRKHYLKAFLQPEPIGNIFRDESGEDYGYCFYIVSTGAYAINRTHFSESTYYDALLERNLQGEAEALLRSGAGESAQAIIRGDRTYSDGTYYVAQAQTGIGNLNLAVTISNRQLAKALDVHKYDIWILCGILGGLYLLMLCFALRFIHNINSFATLSRQNLRAGDMLLRRAANGTQMTLMIYNASSDSFFAYCESDAERKRNPGGDPKSMREMAGRYGIPEEDIEKIYTACRGLKPGDRKDMDFDAVRSGSDLRLHLHLHASDTEKDCIICSLHDCTQDARADECAREELDYRKTMLPRCLSAWEINATENRWHAVYCASNADRRTRELAETAGSWRDYGEDLAAAIRDVLHPDDYAAYIAAVGCDMLVHMYRNGQYECVHEYRVHAGTQGGYEWHRATIRLRKNQENGDILASLYVMNIHSERVAESERRSRSRALNQSLTALGAMYYALYYVELDRDVCRTARAPGGEVLPAMERPYRATFDQYIDRRIALEDRERIRNMLSAYMLRKTMSDTEHLQTAVFTRLNGDIHERVRILVQAARFENGTVRDVVIALQMMERE